MNKIITGIGTRYPPKEIEIEIKRIALMFHEKGWILRSGGADGADSLWESQYPDNKEIYLPWKNFNKNISSFFNISKEAMELASKHHAVWSQLSYGAKCLMSRNCYQVLGYDLNTPSDLVICYTHDGCQSHLTRSIKTGGTGMAIELASLRKIPIINMFNDNWEANLKLTLEEIEHG